MSIKTFFQKQKTELNKDLASIKSDVKKLETSFGSEAEKLKKKISEKAGKVTNGILYAELLPLMVAMNFLLKKKGVTDYDHKNIDSVAKKFYSTFVAPMDEKALSFEYANFDEIVTENLTKYGVKPIKSHTETAYHVDEAIATSTQMSTPEVKDPNNTAGKTAGALVGTALMGAGIPVPPAVTQAIGSGVQGIIRGIINFFKARKDNKDVKTALAEATKEVNKGGADNTLPTEEAPKKDNMKTIIIIVVAVVVIGIGAYFFAKKK